LEIGYSNGTQKTLLKPLKLAIQDTPVFVLINHSMVQDIATCHKTTAVPWTKVINPLRGYNPRNGLIKKAHGKRKARHLRGYNPRNGLIKKSHGKRKARHHGIYNINTIEPRGGSSKYKSIKQIHRQGRVCFLMIKSIF